MCFLIPALVGLISALLGYLLGKMLSGGNDLNLKSKLDACISDNDNLNSKIYLLEKDLVSAKSNFSSSDSSSLQTDLDACRSHSAKLQAEIDSLKAKLSSSSAQGFASVSETLIPFDAAFALAAFGTKVKADDLKIIEGIGPKIAELYHAAGIKTWKALSETPVTKSQAILDAAGNRYAVHNPETWAKQALLAYQGKWAELKEWQENHKGGKE